MDRHLRVRTEDGDTRRVQLGPPWYVDGLDFAPVPGDEVDLVGAPEPGNGGAITARQLNWNGHTYRFRNQEGSPLWAGAAREGWGRYAGAWNSGPIEDVTGEIEGIEGILPGGPDMGRGVVLRLRTRERERERNRGEDQQRIRERARESHRVHLGPYWFVEENMPGLRIGQRVTARGAAATFDGEDGTVATEIVRNQERLRLRSELGRPEWTGGWQNWDGWGPGSRYSRQYDPASEASCQGLVESAEEMTPMPGMGRGLALNVRTRQGTRQRVHIGPMWFVEQADIAPAPGEPISLSGSVVHMNGKRMLMVREMTQANRRLRLRERDGTPVWSGRALAEEAPEAEAEAKAE